MLKFPTNEIVISHDYKNLDDRTMGFLLSHELGHYIQRHHFPAEEGECGRDAPPVGSLRLERQYRGEAASGLTVFNM